MTRLADAILRLARSLLPRPMRHWGDAALREAGDIADCRQALAFAIGCLFWAAGEAMRACFTIPAQEETGMDMFRDLRSPRNIAVACAVAATGLGLAYMAAGGAPPAYLMLNAGALAFGLVVLALLGLADRRGHLPSGPIALALSLALLAASLWGVTADGVTRWVALGPLMTQPGLMLAPLVVLLFARSRSPLALAGVALTALALALQPDRGVAGAVAAGVAVLALVRPGRSTLAAATLAGIGFVATLAQADPSPAVPFVDRILYSSFAVHPLAGAAVLLGSVLLVLPALHGGRAGGTDGSVHAVFGAVWAGIVAAAALGNYPTPLVGYGDSAIVGYLISLVVFAPRASQGERLSARAGARAEPAGDGPALRAGTV